MRYIRFSNTALKPLAVWPGESWYSSPDSRPFSGFLNQYDKYSHPDWNCQIKWQHQPGLQEITDGSLIEARDFSKIDFAICLMSERSYIYFPDSERTRQAAHAVFGDFEVCEISKDILEIKLKLLEIWGSKIKADPSYLNVDEKKLLEMLIEHLETLNLQAICDGMILL